MTTTVNKGYELQATGSNSGTWGSILNTSVFTIIDNNFGGVVTKSLTNVNVTLTSTEAQNLTLVLNGTLTGSVQITNPCVGQFYVDNQCVMGSYSITVTNGVGSAVTIPSSAKIAIIADGTNGCRQVGAGVTNVATGFGLSGGPLTSSGTISISTLAPPYGFDVPINLGLSASVSGNALTISIKDQSGSDPSSTSPVLVPFRNSTSSTGTPTWLAISSALSLTVSSGSTLGTSSTTPFRVWVVLFNNGGTPLVGVINCLTSTGIVPIYEGGLLSSTSEGGTGGADSAGTFYTSTAVTSKAVRILGYIEYTSGLAVAGTWNAAPDIVQLFGPGVKRPGDIVQALCYETAAAVSSGTNKLIPFDDTIPQSTEGFEFATISVTPMSKANKLEIISSLMGATDQEDQVTVALFQDSGANAIAATSVYMTATGGSANMMVLTHWMLPGTTSATTLKVRAGYTRTNTVLTLNGYASARKYGGVSASVLKATEYMA